MEQEQKQEQTTQVVNTSGDLSTTTTTFDLDLALVPYNGKNRVIAGALAQVIKGLIEMKKRIGEDRETDDYKKCLYPKLRELATMIVDKFMPLLSATSDTEKQVKQFNLCGYDGMVKRDRYGRFPFVQKFRPTTSYDYANFGDYLKVLKQRCEYITTRHVPQRYVNNLEEGAAFNKLKTEVTTFMGFLTGTVEPKWTDVVKDARVAGGATVQQNVQTRNEKVTDNEIPQVVPDLLDQQNQRQYGSFPNRGRFGGFRGRGRGRGGNGGNRNGQNYNPRGNNI